VISIGRTGAATPVAVFDPVNVAGTTVRHASIHNSDEIDRLDVRIGDTVIIFKAGEIIPQIARVLKELRPKGAKAFNYREALKEQYPELEFERPDGEVVYRVKGENSDLIFKRSLEYFASKQAMDIDGLGTRNVEMLIDHKLVDDIPDIYRLKKEDLIDLEHFGDLSADNLISAIDNSKHPELERFITGLGIRHVGTLTARDLSNHFRSLDKFEEATIEELEAIDGIGKIVAESIMGWLSDDDNIRTLEKFKELGVNPIYVDHSGDKLTGQSFVITGTLTSMSRDDAANKIRSLGGIFQSSVSRETTYLVEGENTGQGKVEKAKKLGTQVINEKELLDLLK